MRDTLIEFMDSLRDYVAESGTNIVHDERNSNEFVDIFLKQKQSLTVNSVIVPKGTLCCPECKSTDLKVAIHTDYKECNKCYHYWVI